MPKIGTLKDLKNLNLKNTVIVSPSDTTYGLHSISKERLSKIKSRAANFIHLVSSIPMAESIATISNEQKELLEFYWPGPITFVLKGKNPNETVAIRYPENHFCIEMIEAFRSPVLSTSCNEPGGKTVSSIQEAVSLFGDKVDLYIDGGTMCNVPPSTLVDLTQDPAKILRQGLVQFKEGATA